MKSNKNSIFRTIVSVILVTSLLVTFLIIFNTRLQVILEHSVRENLTQTTALQKTVFAQTVQIQFEILGMFAVQFQDYGYAGADKTKEMMLRSVEKYDYEVLALVNQFGGSYSTNGDKKNFSKQENFIAAMEGKPNVSGPYESVNLGENLIEFCVPVYGDNSTIPVGALIAMMPTGKHTQSVAFGENSASVAFAANMQGEIVFKNDALHQIIETDNIVKYLESTQIVDGGAGKLINDIHLKRDGVIIFEEKGERKYLSYTPFGMSDWNIYSISPADVVEKQSTQIQKDVIVLALEILVVLIAILMYFIIMYNKAARVVAAKNAALNETRLELESVVENTPGGIFKYSATNDGILDYLSQGFLDILGYNEKKLREKCNNIFYNIIYKGDRGKTLRCIYEQRANSENITVQYRIVKANGEIRWVHHISKIVTDAKNYEWFYVVLVDITELKLAERELSISEERYRIVSEQSNNIIFEHDIIRNNTTRTSNFHKKFGFDPPTSNFPQCDVDNGFVHKNDANSFLESFKMENLTLKMISGDIRLKKADGQYIWCQLTSTAIFDDNDQPVRIVGKLVDIDTEKSKLIALAKKASTDQLTGLINKASAAQMITTHLKGQQQDDITALIVLDLDGFKLINDILGHLIGDHVLVDIAHILQSEFSDNDIVSRFGGDEFTVMIKAISCKEVAYDRANAIISRVDELSYGENNQKISASMGIDFSSNDEKDFFSLYRNADTALYRAKASGKHCYCVFDEALDA